MCMNICFDLWILCYYFLFVSLFMCCRVCVCVYMLVLMCAAVIETVLQHTVWCLQPESCHKQSAPASVKQQAWENWVLYRLQPTPRSLNRPTHLPNALKSKWAMDIPYDIAIVMRQQVGKDLTLAGDSGRCWALTLSVVEVNLILHCENWQTEHMFLQEMWLFQVQMISHMNVMRLL